jgi:hypothetical protein
LRRLEE